MRETDPKEVEVIPEDDGTVTVRGLSPDDLMVLLGFCRDGQESRREQDERYVDRTRTAARRLERLGQTDVAETKREYASGHERWVFRLRALVSGLSVKAEAVRHDLRNRGFV